MRILNLPDYIPDDTDFYCCPFCGSVPEVWEEYGVRRNIHIQCSNNPNKCLALPIVKGFWKKALKHWNMREV